MIHIFRVQVGRGKNGRQWWICDGRGEQILKTYTSKRAAIIQWHTVCKYTDPVGEDSKGFTAVRYKGIAKPSEAAMCMSELGIAAKKNGGENN